MLLNILHLLGASVLQKFCVFFEGGPGTCPQVAWWSPDGPSLVSASPPSLISTCGHLPLGAQGRAWWLKPISAKQFLGDPGKLVPRSPRGPCLVPTLTKQCFAGNQKGCEALSPRLCFRRNCPSFWHRLCLTWNPCNWSVIYILATRKAKPFSSDSSE